MDDPYNKIDKSLFMKRGEERIFDTPYGDPIGAENAVSKAEMQRVVKDLNTLDFRITYKMDETVIIWVNGDEYAYHKIDKSLLLQPEEKTVFNTPYDYPIGAGNAISKDEMQRIIPDLALIDFRITYKGAGWIIIWVNGDAYAALKTGQKKAADKKSLQEFFKILPLLSFVMIVGSAGLSALTAWQVFANGLFYSNLGAVDFGTAFIRMFAICIGVCILCVGYFILNKGKAN